jgi:hypothetical protein
MGLTSLRPWPCVFRLCGPSDEDCNPLLSLPRLAGRASWSSSPSPAATSVEGAQLSWLWALAWSTIRFMPSMGLGPSTCHSRGHVLKLPLRPRARPMRSQHCAASYRARMSDPWQGMCLWYSHQGCWLMRVQQLLLSSWKRSSTVLLGARLMRPVGCS